MEEKHWPSSEEIFADDMASGRINEAQVAAHRARMRAAQYQPDQELVSDEEWAQLIKDHAAARVASSVILTDGDTAEMLIDVGTDESVPDVAL